VKVIYKAVVIAKILRAIPAWWGFAAASDRQKLGAFLRRGARLKFYSHDEPNIAELVDELGETLYLLLFCITMNMSFVTFCRTAAPVHTVSDPSITILRWLSGATLGTSFNDFYLKTYTNSYMHFCNFYFVCMYFLIISCVLPIV